MSMGKEILGIETLVAGAITAGLVILVALLLGPVLALVSFFLVGLLVCIVIALGPKHSPQISEPTPGAQVRTQFKYR